MGCAIKGFYPLWRKINEISERFQIFFEKFEKIRRPKGLVRIRP